MKKILFNSLLFLLFISYSSCSQTKSNHPVSKIHYFRLGNKAIPVQVSQYGKVNDIVCINVHDNEYTSVDAAKIFLRKHGGLLIKIQNNKQRLLEFNHNGNLVKVDPNRIFSREGILNNLERLHNNSFDAAEQIENFGKFILSLIPDSSKCLIALHNNTPNEFSIKDYVKGNELEADAEEVYINPNDDPDDFILTTDKNLYKRMAALKFNSVLQDNVNAAADGSLSVYYGKKSRSYVNIETEHGKLHKYKKMLKSLLSILENQ